jgi:hypothetical protein
MAKDKILVQKDNNDLGRKQATKQPNKERYYSEFVPDIDNFVGVKNVKNYFLLSMKDEE